SVIGRGSVIENSVIGVRSRIGENVTIRDTYVMGIDFPEAPHHLAENVRLNRPPYGVGDNSVIEGAIIDKSPRLARNVRTATQARAEDAEETPTHVIGDGIVVTHKFIVLPDGTGV